jgi:hypothetical protein
MGRRASVTSASDSPIPDCHSAEHAFLGAVVNGKNRHND